MSTTVRSEEVEVTLGERLLATVLAVFLVIGLAWGYSKLNDVVPSPDSRPTTLTTAERAHATAQDAMRLATTDLTRATEELTVQREAYRTALEAHQPAAALLARYRTAQARRAAAAGTLARATAREEATRAPARAAERARNDAYDSKVARHGWVTFVIRLAYVLAVMALAFWALARVRRISPSRAPLMYAAVGAATVLALILAGDYGSDYISWQDVGPLVVSVVGIALTVVAFAAVQRVILRRLPARRVRHGDCPFCGYPVRGAEHCEGCGRTVSGECTTCNAPRRIGTPHCGTCGSA